MRPRRVGHRYNHFYEFARESRQGTVGVEHENIELRLIPARECLKSLLARGRMYGKFKCFPRDENLIHVINRNSFDFLWFVLGRYD